MKIDLNKLHNRCADSITTSFEWLEYEGGTIVTHRKRRHGFLDRGSNVLAVAHLDHVQEGMKFDKCEDIVFCPRLDDRLGVYTIMDYLPNVGVNVDVLLTDDEEIGMSTAGHFRPKKEYSWMVSFDRRGTDVVTYCYDWGNKLKRFFKVGMGSTSDIAHLGHLGCLGLNVGVGYHREHSPDAYFSIQEWHSQMAKFLKFYEVHKDSPRLFHTNIERGRTDGRQLYRGQHRQPNPRSSKQRRAGNRMGTGQRK